MNRHASRTFHVAVIPATILALVGCSSWHSIGKRPAGDYVAREKPRTVRVSLAESTLVLSQPELHGDSLVGFAKEAGTPQLMGVPVATIRKLEVRSAPTGAKATVGTLWVMSVAMAVALVAVHPRGIP